MLTVAITLYVLGMIQYQDGRKLSDWRNVVDTILWPLGVVFSTVLWPLTRK